MGEYPLADQQNQDAAAVSRRQFFGRAAAAGAAVAVAGPAILLPREAEAGIVKPPSPAQQKQVGDQAAQQVFQKYRRVTDSRARYFEDVGQRLVASLPRQDQRTWDYRFHVLESKEINAFAVPGGNMFLLTGLLNLLGSEDALAAVTGHEMAHVRYQHWAKQHAKDQERQLALGIGLLLFKGGRTAQTIAGLANQVIGLKYSRSDEDQSDKGGLENLVAAGYNPGGMLQLFGTLEKASGGGGRTLGGDFLSDHPLTRDRIKRTQQRIDSLDPGRPFPPLTPLRYAGRG